MIYKHNNIKERFDINVVSEGETIKKTFELDKHAQIVLGFSITSDHEDLLFFRGSQKIQINDCEIFPEDYESKLLMSGLNVAPDNRAATLGEVEAGNGRIDIYYKDTTHPKANFEPYRVSFYFYSKSCK